MARWNGDPALLAVLFGLLIVALRRRDTGRSFYWGWAVLVLLFVSPLCALTSSLFAARTVHHLLLTAIAAPLLVAGWRPRFGGSAPLWALLHALIFWFWHAPSAYSAALSSDLVYWMMQASLLGSAIGLWASLRRSSAPLAVAVLLATMVQMGLLGALLTLAAAPVYQPHFVTTAAWGLSPIEDQQIAGLLMWVPGAGLYLAAALGTGWRLLAPPAQGVKA
jgi:putative membrane protein